MKIGLFTDSDVFAGTERHILDLAVGLRAESCSVEIVCPGRGILAARAMDVGIPVFGVEKGRGIDLPAIRRLSRRLRMKELDLVHAHNGRSALIATAAAAFAGHGQTVITEHFLQPARLRRRGLKKWAGSLFHRWITHRAACIVAISNAVRDGILARGQTESRKVRTIYNGIADPAINPLLDKAAVREALGMADRSPLIVTAVRLDLEKSVDVLIRAMVEVANAFPKARCIVAGEGCQRVALERLISGSGLQNVVKLVGFQKDVHSIFKASDVFVLPSPAEPFGLALVEAMALEIPVIAARAGGPAEIVEEGRSGLLVTPSSSGELANTLITVLSEPHLARRIAAGGRQRFAQCFTMQRMARELSDVYQSLKIPNLVISKMPNTRCGMKYNNGERRRYNRSK